MVFRDRDTNVGPPLRSFAMQDANFNVTRVLTLIEATSIWIAAAVFHGLRCASPAAATQCSSGAHGEVALLRKDRQMQLGVEPGAGRVVRGNNKRPCGRLLGWS